MNGKKVRALRKVAAKRAEQRQLTTDVKRLYRRLKQGLKEIQRART